MSFNIHIEPPPPPSRPTVDEDDVDAMARPLDTPPPRESHAVVEEDDEEDDGAPPAVSKNALIRDVVLRFIHAAFPGARLELPSPESDDGDGDGDGDAQIDMTLIAAGVTELADLLRGARRLGEPASVDDSVHTAAPGGGGGENQQIAEETVRQNQDLVAMCQQLVARLQDTQSAFAPSVAKRRRLRAKQQQQQGIYAPPMDTGVDLDFLLGATNASGTQHSEKDSNEDGDDVVSALRRRVEQLEEEREQLAETCSLLTVQLRNARATVDTATRKFELQCLRTFEEITRVHIAVESLAANTVATNVATVCTTTMSADLLSNNNDAASSSRASPTTVVSASVAAAGAAAAAASASEEDDDAGAYPERSPASSAPASATAAASAVAMDPLDRVYLQSFPALGMGMILQTLAVVFKHEYDVLMMGDGGTGPAPDDVIRAAAHSHHSSEASAAADTSSTVASRQAAAAASDAQDDAEHFENACRQFQMALQKELGPLLASLSSLQNQMGLLSSSGASIRGDYVAKCLQARIKPNSGVMKALTAVAATDRRRIRALDLSNFLVGDHGLAPLAATVESLYRLQRLDLRSNNLHAAGIRTLCAMLRRHPCITEVDLRGNPVGRAGAKLLLGLIAECHRIERIVIDDRAVESSLLSRIGERLSENHPAAAAQAPPSPTKSAIAR